MSLWKEFKAFILRLVNESPKTQKELEELPILKELELLRKTNNLNTINFIYEFLNSENELLELYYDKERWFSAVGFVLEPKIKIEELHNKIEDKIYESNTKESNSNTTYLQLTKYIYDILHNAIKATAEFCLLELKKEFLRYHFVDSIEIHNKNAVFTVFLEFQYSWDKKKIANNQQIQHIYNSAQKYFKTQLNKKLDNVSDFLPYSTELQDYAIKAIAHVEQLKQDFPYHAEQFSNKYYHTLSNINSVLQSEIEELDNISEENEQLIVDIVKDIEQEGLILLKRLISKKNTIEDNLKEAGIESRKTILKLEKEYLIATKELEIMNETIDTATVIKDILNKEDKKKEGE